MLPVEGLRRLLLGSEYDSRFLMTSRAWWTSYSDGFSTLGGHPKPAINGQLKTGHFE